MKLAGVRIELAEIEAALLALPGVKAGGGDAPPAGSRSQVSQSLALPLKNVLVAYIVPDTRCRI